MHLTLHMGGRNGFQISPQRIDRYSAEFALLSSFIYKLKMPDKSVHARRGLCVASKNIKKCTCIHSDVITKCVSLGGYQINIKNVSLFFCVLENKKKGRLRFYVHFIFYYNNLGFFSYINYLNLQSITFFLISK